MKNWFIYQRDDDIEIVKSGFNWWAFLFTGAWALYKGLMLAGLIGLTLMYSSNKSLDENFAIIVQIGLLIVYGAYGNVWFCAKLEKDGYKQVAKIEAASVDGAKAKYLKEHGGH